MTRPPVPPAITAAVPGKAVMLVRQHLINNGCTIPTDVIREALEAAAPHLAAPWAAALARHTHAFTDPRGVELCGGCLREAPCEDAALLEAQP